MTRQGLRLEGGQVHVWRVPCDLPDVQLRRLQPVLSPEERGRADGFHFERDRSRYVAVRGVLRVVLGRYLVVPPDAVRLAHGRWGKPLIAGGPPAGRVRFNVSHSGGLALLAFTLDREVGVDAEQVRRGVDSQQIADRYFAPQEAQWLRRLPPGLRHRSFFELWTRKEAYGKARGTGICDVLDTPVASAGDRMRIGGGPHTGQRRWLVQRLPFDGLYAAALAVEGHEDVRLALWQCPRGVADLV